MDFAAVNKQISTLEACIQKTGKVSPTEQLYVGVDLGTPHIIMVMFNSK